MITRRVIENYSFVIASPPLTAENRDHLQSSTIEQKINLFSQFSIYSIFLHFLEAPLSWRPGCVVNKMAGQEDPQLQQFLMAVKEKMRFQGHVKNLTDACWEKCVDKLSSKWDSKTDTCLVNCVERFIDTSNLVANRFAKIGEE